MSTKTQQKLWNLAWKLLLEAQNSPKSPYGTPVVSTVSTNGVPASRVLVLRGAAEEEGALTCYTDSRSLKVTQLQQSPSFMSWTFWSPEHQLQFSCSGPTEGLSTSICQEVFQGLPKHARKAYAALSPPGTELDQVGDALPDDWATLELDQTNYAAKNFLILKTRITRAEVLQLNREGNCRLLAKRDTSKKWKFQWVVP
ncbi:MAG: hypothetical protein AB8H12_22180 [Lewinella sp.]